ncbi:MAG: alpha/beta hydrolase [Pirellulaceae bacterium]
MAQDENPNVSEQAIVRKRAKIARYVQRTFFSLAVVYLLIVILMSVFETKLVYPGRAASVGNWNPSFVREEVVFRSEDGTELVGWYLPVANSSRTVLVFHGNAENVATTSAAYGDRLRTTLDANVFVFDYRGFGKSAGIPSENLVIQDGNAALEWLLEHEGKVASEVIYYGCSLGGGVALGVAERNPPNVLVLDRTFDSMVNAAFYNYPWIPVPLIMRNRFDNVGRISKLDLPVFQSHFAGDELVPLALGRRLAASAKSVKFLEMPGGHHLARLPEDYWKELRCFFSQIEARELPPGEKE